MGFFSKLFGKSEKIVKSNSVVDYFTPFFGNFGDDITASHVVQSAINSVTKHASKLRMTHYRKDSKDGLTKKGREALNEILQFHPNPVENGADFLEKAMYHWLVGNNAFIFLKFKPSNVIENKEVLDSMWVIDPAETKVTINDAGEVYLTFSINNETERVTTSIDNVAVIKRNLGKDEFFGRTNHNIKRVLEIIDTNYTGVENAIKTSAFIRFIVESATVLNPKIKEEKAEQFAEQFLQAKKHGGVIFTDTANKITQINSTAKYANFKEMEEFYKQVYNYFGTNEKIIDGTYSDQEWNSFYESTIEVFINKLEIEMNKKLFTSKERSFGNMIIIEANKLQQMSITSRLSIIGQVKELGLLTINEMRELIYMPPVENGDIREVSLNYVDADKQNVYQVGDETNKESESEEEQDE